MQEIRLAQLLKVYVSELGISYSFLKHLRRSRLLLHVVDIGTKEFSDLVNAIRTVERELKEFDEELATRSRWMILNKSDLVAEHEIDRVATELMGALSWEGPWYIISAATGEGCESLTGDVFSWIEKANRDGVLP